MKSSGYIKALPVGGLFAYLTVEEVISGDDSRFSLIIRIPFSHRSACLDTAKEVSNGLVDSVDDIGKPPPQEKN